MIREKKTFEISCERCGKTVTVQSVSTPDLPKGWKTVSVGPCGMTNYYRDEIRCIKCKTKD